MGENRIAKDSTMKRVIIGMGLVIVATTLVWSILLPYVETMPFMAAVNTPSNTPELIAALAPSPTNTPTTSLPATPTTSPSASSTPSPTASPTLSPTNTPIPEQSENGLIETNITYCTVDGVDLKMDVYYPQSTDELLPVAMYVHGGGFTGGDKQAGSGKPFIQPLVNSGYLVVSVNYRLAPQYPFPAPIEDVKCAIRSLRANAGKYNLDVNRIGVFGSSAGGQLVSLLGTMDASAGMEGNGGYLEQSSRVHAVVSMAGPSDLTLICSLLSEEYKVFCQDTEALLAYSPLSYVSPDDPPFLLLHGELDTIVSPIHSELLLDKLTDAGVPVRLTMVQNAAHVFSPRNGEMQPSLEELFNIVIRFFNAVLK